MLGVVSEMAGEVGVKLRCGAVSRLVGGAAGCRGGNGNAAVGANCHQNRILKYALRGLSA